MTINGIYRESSELSEGHITIAKKKFLATVMINCNKKKIMSIVKKKKKME